MVIYDVKYVYFTYNHNLQYNYQHITIILPIKRTNLEKVRKGELGRQNDKPKQQVPASYKSGLEQPLPFKTQKTIRAVSIN